MEESSTSGVDSTFKTNILIVVIAAILFTVLAFLLYTYYKTKQTLSTTPGVTNTGTAGNEVSDQALSYPNERFFYSFECPGNSVHSIDITDGDGTTKPFLHETCKDAENLKNMVNVYVMSVDANEIASTDEIFVKSFNTKSGKERVSIMGADRSYFDKVVASFKFTQ